MNWDKRARKLARDLVQLYCDNPRVASSCGNENISLSPRQLLEKADEWERGHPEVFHSQSCDCQGTGRTGHGEFNRPCPGKARP